MSQSIKKISKIVALFLVPGAIIATAYYLLISPVVNRGYPNMIALVIACIFVLIPLLLGILYYSSKKEYGVFSLSKAIKYKQPIAKKHYLWLIPLLLVWAAGVFTFLKPLDEFIKTTFFGWIPEKFILSGDFTSLAKPQLLISFILVFLFVGILAPIVEEIYFRGFLYPKMEWMGKASSIVHALLFSLYHFWSPWQMITRFIAIFPFCYVAYKTKNIKVAIIVHCLLNIFGDAMMIFMLYLQA